MKISDNVLTKMLEYVIVLDIDKFKSVSPRFSRCSAIALKMFFETASKKFTEREMIYLHNPFEYAAPRTLTHRHGPKRTTVDEYIENDERLTRTQRTQLRNILSDWDNYIDNSLLFEWYIKKVMCFSPVCVETRSVQILTNIQPDAVFSLTREGVDFRIHRNQSTIVLYKTRVDKTVLCGVIKGDTLYPCNNMCDTFFEILRGIEDDPGTFARNTDICLVCRGAGGTCAPHTREIYNTCGHGNSAKKIRTR